MSCKLQIPLIFIVKTFSLSFERGLFVYYLVTGTHRELQIEKLIEDVSQLIATNYSGPSLFSIIGLYQKTS